MLKIVVDVALREIAKCEETIPSLRDSAVGASRISPLRAMRGHIGIGEAAADTVREMILKDLNSGALFGFGCRVGQVPPLRASHVASSSLVSLSHTHGAHAGAGELRAISIVMVSGSFLLALPKIPARGAGVNSRPFFAERCCITCVASQS